LSQSIANPYFVQGGAGIVGSRNVSRAQTLRPFPAFGNINLQFSDRNLAQYDSLVFKAQKAYSNGLSLLASLTWSKNFDRSSGGAGNNINAGNVAPQNPYDLESEWSLSMFDATRRYSMTGSYDLPFGSGKKFLNHSRAVDLAVGGWKLNVVNIISSGFP